MAALPAAMVMSGLPREQFSGDLEDLYDHGALLLRSPGSPPLQRSKEPCSPTSPLLRSLEHYVKVIGELEMKFEKGFGSVPTIPTFWTKLESSEPEIPYQNRDLLDLYSNISGNFEMTVARVATNNVDSFFLNRSQISRLKGAPLPRHVNWYCKKCEFCEPLYY